MIMPEPFFVDAAKAKEAAAKGHATQSRIAAERRKLREAAKFRLAVGYPEPEPVPPAPQPAVIPAVIPADDGYRQERLERTRRQIELLDGMLDNCKTPLDVDKISNSLRRLYDIEADLAGRPGRGNRHPAPERPQRTERRLIMPLGTIMPIGSVIDVRPTPIPSPPQTPPAEPPAPQ